jgi:hypothetical protein
VSDPDVGKPGYDESLDSEFIDPDPAFRETLRLLNARGVHTVSSCQGHAPGAQYPHVTVWMQPYITCRVTSKEEIRATRRFLKLIGGRLDPVSSENKVRASFRRNWEWKRSVEALKASEDSVSPENQQLR